MAAQPPRLTEQDKIDCQSWQFSQTPARQPKPPPGEPPPKTTHNCQRVQSTIIAKDPKLRRAADERTALLQRHKVEAVTTYTALWQKRQEHKKEVTKKEKEEVVTKEDAVTTEFQPLLRDLRQAELACETGKRDYEDWLAALRQEVHWTAKPKSEMTKGELEMLSELQGHLNMFTEDSGDVRDKQKEKAKEKEKDACLPAPRPVPPYSDRKKRQRHRRKMRKRMRMLEQDEADEATKRRKKYGGLRVVLRSRSETRVRR